MNLRPMNERLFSSMYCVQTMCNYIGLWIPFDVVMMWVEVLLSVGAQVIK